MLNLKSVQERRKPESEKERDCGSKNELYDMQLIEQKMGREKWKGLVYIWYAKRLVYLLTIDIDQEISLWIF